MAQNFSFDIVSEVNFMEVENAINQAQKELSNRYDFKGTKSSISYNKDDKKITLIGDDDYKLRSVKDIPEKAVRMAVEANSDPSARNIRVAVVVADQSVADSVRNVAALAETGNASAMKIFTDINEAEAWLARPLDQI